MSARPIPAGARIDPAPPPSKNATPPRRGPVLSVCGIGCLALCLTACATTGAYPPAADIAAVTEAKPQPTADILTDPAANDRYNSAIEARGDRLYAAGARLCRFFARTGMRVDCPA